MDNGMANPFDTYLNKIPAYARFKEHINSLTLHRRFNCLAKLIG